MRKVGLVYISLIVILSLICWGFFAPVRGFAATVSCTGTEFGIATDLPESFLKAVNMAPGDRVTANLTVKNIGQHDFSYKISASLEAGDVDLYNLLLLDLVDAAGSITFQADIAPATSRSNSP